MHWDFLITGLISIAASFCVEIKPKIFPLNYSEPSYSIKAIVDFLKNRDENLVIDTVAFESALATIGAYKNVWGLTDDMMEKLYEIVYDPYLPERAEVEQNICEALKLASEYSKTVEIQEL